MTDRIHGPIIWFTGPPGAGKTTLASVLRPSLAGHWPVEILDGDEVRLWLSEGLGFSRLDRDRNIARIARVACLLARHGVAVLVAAVSPYAAARAEARGLAQSQGIPFFEVFVTAPLAALTERDPKGLYRKAQAGQIANFTGLSDPYEAPAHPDLVLHTETESIAESAGRVLASLRSSGLLTTNSSVMRR
ncbi:MAG TPA: adenylyl-sulfate kinase [Polyangia bacterium]